MNCDIGPRVNRIMNLSKKILYFSLLSFAIMAFIIFQVSSQSATLGLMGIAEQLSIKNLQFIEGVNGANDAIKVTVINVGRTSATITKGSMDGVFEYSNGYWKLGANYSLIEMSPSAITMKKGSFGVLTLSFKPDTLVSGTKYNLELLTAKGTSIVNCTTYDSALNAEYDPVKDKALQLQLQQVASRPDQVYPFQNVLVGITSIALTIELGACLLIYAKYSPLSNVKLSALIFLTFITVIVTLVIAVSSYMSTILII